MKDEPQRSHGPGKPNHGLTGHEGILRVETHPGHAMVDVEFDPSKLSDSEVRSLLKEHISQVESAIRKPPTGWKATPARPVRRSWRKKSAAFPASAAPPPLISARCYQSPSIPPSSRRIASPTI